MSLAVDDDTLTKINIRLFRRGKSVIRDLKSANHALRQIGKRKNLGTGDTGLDPLVTRAESWLNQGVRRLAKCKRRFGPISPRSTRKGCHLGRRTIDAAITAALAATLAGQAYGDLNPIDPHLVFLLEQFRSQDR